MASVIKSALASEHNVHIRKMARMLREGTPLGMHLNQRTSKSDARWLMIVRTGNSDDNNWRVRQHHPVTKKGKRPAGWATIKGIGRNAAALKSSLCRPYVRRNKRKKGPDTFTTSFVDKAMAVAENDNGLFWGYDPAEFPDFPQPPTADDGTASGESSRTAAPPKRRRRRRDGKVARSKIVVEGAGGDAVAVDAGTIEADSEVDDDSDTDEEEDDGSGTDEEEEDCKAGSDDGASTTALVTPGVVRAPPAPTETSVPVDGPVANASSKDVSADPKPAVHLNDIMDSKPGDASIEELCATYLGGELTASGIAASPLATSNAHEADSEEHDDVHTSTTRVADVADDLSFTFDEFIDEPLCGLDASDDMTLTTGLFDHSNWQ